MRMRLVGWAVTFVLAGILSPAAGAQGIRDIPLPQPRMEGGKPLLSALRERHSSRSFRPEPLPRQLLSDLLWAAAGINRPETGKRTAPSAMNWQEVEVWVIAQEGAYLYDAKANSLVGIVEGDLRRLTGIQEFVAGAPLNLVYVADTTKVTRASPEDLPVYLGADAAFISQNVYLFCASEGLATVVRASIDRKALADALRLPDQKRIIMAQTVGYPADPAEEAR